MINRALGFTLIELAMVMFILALMLGAFLTPLSSTLEQRDREKTANLLEDIRESLIGYALVNGHFPCPDCPDNVTGSCATVEGVAADMINDGIEDGVDFPVVTATNDRTSADFVDCATEVGNLPWATIGIHENDAWGNHFIYRVTDNFADATDGTGANCNNPAAGISFCLDSAVDADIDINDANGVSIATDVPVVVVSTGNSNVDFADLTVAQIAALSANEQENVNMDNVFVSDDYISETGTYFDDLLVWITPPTIMYQMVRAEKLP